MPLLDALCDIPAAALVPVLDAAGVDKTILAHADAVINFAQFDTLLTGLAQYTGRTDLGFELGTKIKLEHHQALGLVLRRCDTIDELLRVLARYSRLVSPSFTLRYRRTATYGEFVWQPAAFMSSETMRALEELFAVSMQVEMRDMLGKRLLPFDVYLSMQAPKHQARYAELRPARYHFGTLSLPEVKFVFSAELLDLPLHATTQRTTEALRQQLSEQQRDIGLTDRWSEWVTLILREAEGCQPSREELAALLNVSRATLTRRLAAEGHSVRELGIRIRHERACALLQDRHQSISQIAYRLGYSDVANFSRAFRARGGIGPNAHRVKYCQQG